MQNNSSLNTFLSEEKLPISKQIDQKNRILIFRLIRIDKTNDNYQAE